MRKAAIIFIALALSLVALPASAGTLAAVGSVPTGITAACAADNATVLYVGTNKGSTYYVTLASGAYAKKGSLAQGITACAQNGTYVWYGTNTGTIYVQTIASGIFTATAVCDVPGNAGAITGLVRDETGTLLNVTTSSGKIYTCTP